jgi:hypothetical protein
MNMSNYQLNQLIIFNNTKVCRKIFALIITNLHDERNMSFYFYPKKKNHQNSLVEQAQRKIFLSAIGT